MTTDLIIYPTVTDWIFGNSVVENLYINYDDAIGKEKRLPEVLFITSFPPRECGIATYSQDLINALNNQFENSFTCSVCVLESETEQHNYEQQPKYILNTDSRNSFIKTAFYIN